MTHYIKFLRDTTFMYKWRDQERHSMPATCLHIYIHRHLYAPPTHEKSKGRFLTEVAKKELKEWRNQKNIRNNWKKFKKQWEKYRISKTIVARKVSFKIEVRGGHGNVIWIKAHDQKG